MFRSYRCRIYPTPAQSELLMKHFGCVRWIYNWALAEKSNRYVEAGANVSFYEFQSHLPELKERSDTKWLGEVAAASLQGALRNLDIAFTRFFKGISSFPQFKARGQNDSYQVQQYTSVNFDTQKIKITGFKEGIKGCFNRKFIGKIKTTTISRAPTGKFYASVLVDDGVTEPALPPLDEVKALGLDFGIKDLIVTSEGERFENPQTLKCYQRRLKIRQRRMSRKAKGSKNRDKARLRVALTHETISNVRNDNLHKISSYLVRENQATTLCIEDLSVSDMVTDSSRGRSMNRSIMDAGWRELRRQIEYKAKWHGKNVKVIGRFEPSSKMCSDCGHIHTHLTLADRQWTCVSCGSTHDRDINAARNIKTMAFREQNTSSGSLASANYREATRKVTPVDQPVGAEMTQECRVLSSGETDHSYPEMMDRAVLDGERTSGQVK